MNRQVWGTIFVALSASGWGTWALFLRGHGLPPAWQSTMILLVIAVTSLPLALRRRGPARTGAQWGLLGLAALSDAGNYLCYFGALDRGPISVAVLTHYLAPVVVTGFAAKVLGERLTRRGLLSLGVSILGLALLVLGDGGLPASALPTALLGGGSALFYGANTLITKKLFGPFENAEVLSYHSWLSAGLVALVAGSAMPPLASFLWTPLLGALLLGAIGASLFYAGLRFIPAQRAAVLTYLEPLVAALIGVLVFGERLGPAGVAGGVLILAGGAAVALQK